MEKENDNDKIKKCLKSFLMAKKFLEKDNDTAFEYFKQSLKYITLVKPTNKNLDKNIIDVLNETESECNKYINLTVEKTIEKEKDSKIEINLFDIIEKGKIEDLKQIKSYQLNFNIYDDEGNTPIHKAIKFGDTLFLKTAFKLGAPLDIVNKFGHTALEFACLEKDPNMINFLLKNGADMKKHLLFRDGNKKYTNNQNYIDCAIILKLIFTYQESENYDDVKFILHIFDPEEKIGFDDYNYLHLVKCLSSLLDKQVPESKDLYLEIIREELNYPLKNSLGCPYNKLELLLTNLAPFINYPFSISSDWYINLELKYLIIKLLKEKPSFNIEIKGELINYLWENYIKNNIFQEEYLGNLICQWVTKLR
jgi:hypothetical protein